jgi:two-component system NtrC family response regulator
MEKLLIIDDSEDIRKQLKWGLKKDYSLLLAGNVKEALSQFRKHRPLVVTLDLGLPPHEDGAEEGLKCLKQMIMMNPFAKIIIITGNNERENALKAVTSGAYDYYEKPIDLDEMKVILKRAFQLSAIEQENRRLHIELEKQTSEWGGMVGQCPEMLDVFSTIRKVASFDAAILIQGESGTGKELVARAIHAVSLRKEGPFIPINCGAIPENLLESELFGHEKGAFTGAHIQIQGKVEFADKGTLFLDEIGELPLNLQVKLLRFLQEKTIQRVGGRQEIPVDARIICASNMDIAKAKDEGSFRDDLYFRIGVITIKLPPLRDRRGDIMLLSNLFLKRTTESVGKKIKGFSPSAVNVLQSYMWSGNVRELENRIQRAVIMSESTTIEADDLGFTDVKMKQRAQSIDGLTLKDAREIMEKEMIASVVEKYKGNIARASEELGISRPSLYDLLKKHRISYASPEN